MIKQLFALSSLVLEPYSDFKAAQVGGSPRNEPHISTTTPNTIFAPTVGKPLELGSFYSA